MKIDLMTPPPLWVWPVYFIIGLVILKVLFRRMFPGRRDDNTPDEMIAGMVVLLTVLVWPLFVTIWALGKWVNQENS